MDRFKAWCADLTKLCELTIPRSYFTGPFEDLELHVFGDSSQDVFSAVAFLRAKVNSCAEIAFVIGKARVAPMKTLTVPKLELQAAVLAARLSIDIRNALTIPIQHLFLWSDSTIVLQWLKSLDKQPIFIANRVSEILETTSADQWNHVATSDNPADAGTRGMSSEALACSNWLRGPDFLRTIDFPFIPDTSVLDNLQRKKSTPSPPKVVECLVVNRSKTGDTIDYKRFSSYPKLVRVVCYIFRLLPKHANFRTADKSVVDPAELRRAEEGLIFLSQTESFAQEKRLLSLQKPVQSKSQILTYSPFIGPRGILRSTGRIKRFTEVDYNLKHPILLDGRHPFVNLYLRNQHLENHHEGVDYLRALVQRNFAVLKLRSVLRSIRFHCVLCRKRSTNVFQPMMADLPKERLAFQSPPFTNTGIDYFGPLFVSVRRSSEKRWGFLFTCLTTRAVHIEIVPSLDTSSCVMGIERFIARRGSPSVLWSDNGTNFIGAEKELLMCILNWNQKVISSKLAHKGITWKFNPPAAPHHGGPWERMVRSVKRSFYATLGNRRLTDEVLNTTMCLVEQILNNRPITPVSSNHDDLEALTPNHFLLGNRSAPLPSLASYIDFDHRKRYARAQAYADAIWSRWLAEFVPLLNRRSKWSTPSTELLKVGDLVWVADESAPRGHFPMARVVELHFGSDCIARSAVIKMPSGTLVRPLVKLIPVFDSSSSAPEDVANAN